MWNGLHQLILPAVLLNFVNYQKKNTTLGLLTFAGLFIAAIVQPISGALSDRWYSVWGRRRPLILFGTLGDFIFLGLLAWAGGLIWIVIGYIGLQITSNVAHGPTQGLLPDQVPPDQRGLASSVKNIMDMAGLLIAMVVLGRVLDPNARHLVPSMAIVAVCLACGAAITLIGVREQPSITSIDQGIIKDGVQYKEASRARIHSYTWLIASRFVFLFGVYGIQGFIQYYIRDVMGGRNPVKFTGDLLALIIIALMVFAMAGGPLGDRIGHKRVLYIASLIAAIGSILLMGSRTPITMLVFGSVFGAGIGLFLTSNWALANILVPSEQAGKYLGLSNVATAGAGAVARLAGPFIDVFNNAKEGLYLGYTLLFALGAVATLASILLLRRVEEM
jgi:MFS family permease